MTVSEKERNFFCRRRFLQLAGSTGFTGLAGCSSGEPTESPAGEPTSTTTETPSPSTTPTPTPTQDCRTEPSSDEGWWPMHHHDGSNTQTNRGSTGPKQSVEPSWTFETDGAVRSSPAVVNGSVYVGSKAGTVYALNMVTGEQEWVFETDGPVVSSPAVVDDTVFIGSDDTNLYALDARTGEQQWAKETNGPIRSSPTVARGVVGFGSQDVYILDAETGEVNWHRSVAGAVTATPIITLHFEGTRLWFEVGTTGGHSVGHDVGRGRDNYHIQNRIDAEIHSSISTFFDPDDGENFFYGADDGILRKDDNYTAGWTFETDGKIRSSPAVIEDPDRVYVGSWDQKLYAVGAFSGDQHWAFETGGKIESSPTVADGHVYVGSGDGNVYALDTESGEESWSFQTDGAVYSSPAVVNGSVFVGSDDGQIYALTVCQ